MNVFEKYILKNPRWTGWDSIEYDVYEVIEGYEIKVGTYRDMFTFSELSFDKCLNCYSLKVYKVGPIQKF